TSMPLFFREVRLPVGNDEPEIARARVIDAWIVDLIEDTVAQRKPDSAVAADSGTNSALRARRPAGRNTWPTRGKPIRLLLHARTPNLSNGPQTTSFRCP